MSLKHLLLSLSFLTVTACNDSLSFSKKDGKAAAIVSATSSAGADVLSEEQTRSLRSQSFATVYQRLYLQLPSEDVTIEGLTFTSLKSRIRAMKDKFEALESRYGTIGEYLDAKGVGPSIAFDPSAFKQALLRAHKHFKKDDALDPAEDYPLVGARLLEENACYTIEEAANARNMGYCLGSSDLDINAARAACAATTAAFVAQDHDCPPRPSDQPFCTVDINGKSVNGGSKAECDLLNENAGQIMASKAKK